MFRRRDRDDAVPSTSVGTWQGAGLTADAVQRPARRGRVATTVVLTVEGAPPLRFAPAELTALVAGRAEIAEADNSDHVGFLATARMADSTTLPASTRAQIPPDGHVLLTAVPRADLSVGAVLDATTFASFAQWVDSLPG